MYTRYTYVGKGVDPILIALVYSMQHLWMPYWPVTAVYSHMCKDQCFWALESRWSKLSHHLPEAGAGMSAVLTSEERCRRGLRRGEVGG